MSNVTVVYWDNLEATHGPLVCAPNGGDPDYAFVCAYTLTFLPPVHLITALWLFATTYQELQLFRWTKFETKTPSRIGSRPNGTLASSNGDSSQGGHSPKPRKRRLGDGMLSRYGGKKLSHGGRIALVVGVLSLSRGVGLILSGLGTSHAIEELRGKIGDGFCKYGRVFLLD
jgi:hypothetical protein